MMNKILILSTLFLAFGVYSASAQSCCKKGAEKSCSKTEASAKLVTYDEATLAAATKLAEQNDNIDKKVCDYSGKVSFTEKSVSPETGDVVLTKVVYSAEKEAFVPESKENGTSCCSIGEQKKCSSATSSSQLKTVPVEGEKTTTQKKAKV